jgi:hypothetical protein
MRRFALKSSHAGMPRRLQFPRFIVSESGVAPGAASWLTGSASNPENVGDPAAESLKFDAY